MLLKDRFITVSSKSITNNSGNRGSDTPIQYVKGVGPKLGAVFNFRQIQTVKDLFHFFPRTYEDRSQLSKVAQLSEGMSTTLTVQIISQRQIAVQRGSRFILEVRCGDETGQLTLKWFYPPRGIEKKFLPGIQLVVTGKVKMYMGRPEIIHPEISWRAHVEADEVENNYDFGRIIPVYTEIEGVPTRTLRKVLWEALEKFGSTLSEDIPAYLLERRGLPDIVSSVRAIHFPPESPKFELALLAQFKTPAHQRLVYGEFFKFEYLILRQRLYVERAAAQSFRILEGREYIKSLASSLPFQLTTGQSFSIEEILGDLSVPHPMNRLVQGDVGSGKTVVALLTSAYILKEGSQAALMAPTEILAEQHFKNTLKLFGEAFKVVLLTGKTSEAERLNIHTRLMLGEPLLVIGTHALLEEGVTFKCLSYVMIDEQHRFGVEQRRVLKQKGTRIDPLSGKTLLSHSLILTATPIPRTLALTAFGDLTVSTIRELPPGRSPILTQVVRDRSQRTKVYEKIRKELAAGRQSYFVYPLIHESEAEGFTQLKSAVAEAELLANEIFPEYTVALLHGQLPSEEKAAVMDKFQKGEVNILVSTTVIEVGVDVPNATVMAIEHAERFGLSQLHQLRGRVGRGAFQSFCYLFSHPRPSENTAHRLEVLEETQDGFKIAEADLELRGPGEFLGTRQAGGLPFKLANLVRDQEWLMKARDDVMQIMRDDPDLIRPEHLSLRNYYKNEGGLQFERLGTS